MNIKQMHTNDKAVSAVSIFKSETGNATAIQILAKEKLKEHVTKVPAMLICIAGNAVFENEKGIRETLFTGDYILIEPEVKHWVEGIVDSQLLLVK
ncbi:MAG: hypothetical protein IPN36_11420 [Bacteroidetes bacterium]|nr:hypothetical protein [Bacteroidota bacterium]